MASGPEEYLAAVKLLAESRSISGDDLDPAQLLMATLAEAQVRATLAVAAASAMWADMKEHPENITAWRAAVLPRPSVE